jgi:hypothetical protein
MEKSFATDDHAELLSVSGGRACTFFERPSRGVHITKSASDVIGIADMQANMPPSTHFGVHLITMGAEETFGANRNGDSASQRSLDQYHGTFEKFGHVFREHKNKDPHTQGVGLVKLARVNPRMHRGELIIWVEKDKAPDMYKKASDGEELSWSMSMRLPHDECSCCRKKSRTTADYCSHLKNNMLKWVPGFEKFAYARNEEGVKFFDISEVKRRADRIATYLGYYFHGDELAKAASDGQIITGAQWAEYQFGPARVTPFDAWEELTLEKLAAAEEFVRHADPETLATLARMAPQSLSREQIEILAQPDFRSVGGELAKRAMIINFHDFATLVTGKSKSELEKIAEYNDAVGAKLPTLLTDLMRDGGCCCGEEAAEAVAPDEVGCSFSPGKDNIDRLMAEAGGNLGMDQANTSGRAVQITIIKSGGVRQPTAARDLDPYYAGLVSAYGYYLVKAAHQSKDLPGVVDHNFFRSLAAGLAILPS